jgi:hypothetical protein
VWRKISEAAIRLDDSRIQALLQLPETSTADQLQKFVCAASFRRATIFTYAEAVPLVQELLKSFQSEAGSMKQSKLKKLAIGERWTYEHNQCFQVRALNQPDFVWPTLEEIKKAQQEVHSLCESTNSLDPSDGLYKTIDGKIWVPDRDDLRQRMCVIAHC